jgi:hypothetical protein
MRVPLIRFGNDDRPIEPWENCFAPVLVVVIPLVFAVVLFVSAMGVIFFLVGVLVRAVLSPILPRSWRLNWDTAFDLSPTVDSKCPACQSQLTLGPVNKLGHVVRTDKQREFVMPSQAATCPQCQREFGRFSLGKVWTTWSEVDASLETD